MKMALLAAVAFDGGRRLMTGRSMLAVDNELNRGGEWQRSIVALAFNGGGNGQQQGGGGGKKHINATRINQIEVTAVGGDHIRLWCLT
jgi:hypothetical protein